MTAPEPELPACLRPAQRAVEHARAALARAEAEGRDLVQLVLIDTGSRGGELEVCVYRAGIDGWRDAQADWARIRHPFMLGVLVHRRGRRSLVRVEGAGGSWEQRS